MTDTVCAQIIALLKRKEMTIEELRRELVVARSTVNNMVKYLRQEKRVCVVRYEYTGVKPVRYLGLGAVDAPRPSPMSREEKNRRRREAKAREREAEQKRLQTPTQITVRRDVAASWF